MLNVSELLDSVREDLPLDECSTCECWQGLLTQISIDHPENADILPLQSVPASEAHGCLGCDPCPPGDAFAAYLKDKNARRNQGPSLPMM